MDYLNSPINSISKQNKFYQYSKRIGLLKKNYSSNRIFNLKDEYIYKKYSPGYHYIDRNNNSVNNINKDLNSINDSQKEFEESSEDIIISAFKTHDTDSLKSEKKNIIRNNNNLKNKIHNINNNRKLSSSFKRLLVNQSPQIKSNDRLITINDSLKNRSSNYYIDLIKKNNNKYNDLINTNKTLFNNLTERNLKINNLLKENKILKSKVNNYLLEEYQSKLNNDNLYYDKYNKLEKEFKILKDSIIDYQKQNKVLKQEINNLKIKNDKEIEKENFHPIKVNIKDTNKSNITNKNNNNIELIIKENNKLLKENKIYKSQIEEYVQKIKDLLIIIKNKDNYIKLLKNKIIDVKENINNNQENFIVVKTESNKENNKDINNNNIRRNNFINKSVDKLIIENEENKKKIKQIFEKIKDLGNFEKEYKQYININLKDTKESSLLRGMETTPKNINIIKNNTKIDYKIEKNEIKIENNINKNNYKIDYQIQNNNIKILNNNNKNNYINKDHNYQIQRIEMKVINNNCIYNNNNNKKEKKLQIINPNEDSYISNEIKEKGKEDIQINQFYIKKENQKYIKKNYLNNQNIKIEKENNSKKYIINSKNKITEKRNNRFSNMNEESIREYKKNEELSHVKLSSSFKEEFEQAKKEVKEEIEEKDKKRNHTHKPKSKKKIRILDGIDITEINTSRPVRIQSSLSFQSNNDINKNYLYLYGLDKNNNLVQFDLVNKKWLKQQKISDIEDLSDSLKNNYIYENSIFYNVLNGFFILTGKFSNLLYYYNGINETIIKVCEFNYQHHEGSLLLDTVNNRIFVFSGKNNKKCEYYSFNDKSIYEISQLNNNRANASYVIHKNKIYCFFGFSNYNYKYNNTIEYIDIQKLDKWKIIANTTNDFDKFIIEKIALINENEFNHIYFYCGTKNNQDKNEIIEENLIRFDTKTNKIDIINDIRFTQYKFIGRKWRKCDISNNKRDIKFFFEKNTNFIELPSIENVIYTDTNKYVNKLESNSIKVLIDSNNNVHYYYMDLKNVEIFRCYYK